MSAAARLVEVRVPDLGNFKDVAVIDVLVKPGESVAPETPLITLESDKATMDVPSTAGGVIEKLHVAKGGTVSTGDLVATLRSATEAAAAAAAAPAPAPGPAPAATPASGGQLVPRSQLGKPTSFRSDLAPIDEPGFSRAHAGPSVRKFARELGVDLARITGRGFKGRITHEDVKAFVKSALAPGAAAAGTAPAAPGATAAPEAGAAAGGAFVPRSQLGRPTSFRSDLAPIDEPGFSRAHAGPSVRQFARELGVDLARVTGRGFKGRITHEDVKAFVKSALVPGAAATRAPPAPAMAAAPVAAPAAAGGTLPALPQVDFAQFGPVETQPLSRIQRISGPRLQASWANIPHVTQFDEADITDLEQTRAALKDRAQAAGVKLTPLAFIMRACVKTLQEFPRFNSALDPSGQNLIVRKFINVGFAADTANGLVVPVVREAHRMDVYQLARQLAALAEKARSGKLPPTDMQGGCFTISSLGGIGGTAFTPIINAPEVAILGVSRASMRPVFRDGAFVARLILPLSLSYDHRVIDGAMAARFTTFLAQTLADPRALLEAVL